MHIAKVSPKIAKRLGLNSNHHARVWCSCMDDSENGPGFWAGMHPDTVNERTIQQAATDTRRLGSYDALGVIDMRVPGSALELYRAHVREADRGTD